MVNVYLHGMLGRKFGKVWEGMHVSTASEALHAINVNVDGKLRAYFAQNPTKEYKVKIGKTFVEEKVEISGPCGNQEIHILPVIKGRNSGLGKIFTAIAIIAIAYFTGFYDPSEAGAFGGIGGAGVTGTGALTFSGTMVASITAALLLGGISQLLTPKVNLDNSTTSNQGSFAFGGNINTVQQGVPVPVAYGRVMISPLPISVSYFNIDYTAGGTVTTDPQDGNVGTDAGFDGTQADGTPSNTIVGQSLSVSTKNNLYLGGFGNTSANPSLGPNTIPAQTSPYAKSSV